MTEQGVEAAADIFISYKREEQDKARQLADALEKQGWSVWWDPKLRAGEYFNDVIEKALKEARCVIVLWSKRSVKSRYVKDESSYALNQGKLVPVAIEEVELPFRFRGIHMPQLTGWDGSEHFPAFLSLVDDIAEKLGKPVMSKLASATEPAIEEQSKQSADQQTATPSIQRGKPWAKWIPVAAIAATAAVGVVYLFYLFDIGYFEEVVGIGDLSTGRESTRIEPATDDVSPSAGEAIPVEPDASTGSDITGVDSAAVALSARTGEVFRDTFKDGSKGPEMVVIGPGEFKMGCVSGKECEDDELPVHKVTFDKRFAIGKYEVTFEEFDRFAKATGRDGPGDQGWGREQRPVMKVSWQDAVAYARWLSEQTRKRYRLPTEAEWEYVARAGTQTKYWWGDKIGKNRANCAGCGSEWDHKQTTAPVGSFKPNPWRLHDTAGNVWEWVEDCQYGSYEGAPDDGSAREEANGGDCDARVIRGGAWDYIPRNLRSAYRYRNYTDYRLYNIGFRLAQDF